MADWRAYRSNRGNWQRRLMAMKIVWLSDSHFNSEGAVLEAPAPQPEWSLERFQPAAEVPNLGVISQCGGDINLQYLQFCDHAVGT